MMIPKTIIFILVAVFIIIAITVLIFIGKAQNRKNLQKLIEYTNKRGYKLYPANEMDKFLKILEPTLFYKTVTMPFVSIRRRRANFYNIIDTGAGKFAKLYIHARRGMGATYFIYIDYDKAPNMLINRVKNQFLAQGFSQYYSNHGYIEVNIPGLTGEYYVFGKDANAVHHFLENKVQALNNELDDYSIEVADNIFICYSHYQKIKLEDYDAVIEKCRKIKSLLAK